MPDRFYIAHPKRGRFFPAPFFVAYGRWPAPADIRGVLKDGSGAEIATGQLVLSNRNTWALVFRGMPSGRGYTLEVTTGGETRTVTDLEVVAHTAITVMYPTEDDLPVGTTFITYGSTSVTTALSASLSPNGGGSVRYLWGPPDSTPYWAFEFDGVAVGSYTLTVQGGVDTTQADVDVL